MVHIKGPSRNRVSVKRQTISTTQATTNMFEARREPTHAHLVPPLTIPTVYLYLHAGDWTAEAVDGGGILLNPFLARRGWVLE